MCFESGSVLVDVLKIDEMIDCNSCYEMVVVFKKKKRGKK